MWVVNSGMGWWGLGAVISFLFLFAFSVSAEIFETKDIRDVIPRIQDLVEKYGAENVLFVADYDNTVAESAGVIGGEPWFEALLEEHGSERYHDIVLLQRAVFGVNRARLVQAETPKVIGAIQNLGVKTMLVTSRNRHFASATANELAYLKVNLGALTLVSTGISSEPFSISADPHRRVLYFKGLYFTAGLPKGPALRSLLTRANWRPKAIVFVDDRLKHAESFEEVFGGPDSGIELTVYRYGATDEKIHSEKGTKAEDHLPQFKQMAEQLRLRIKPKHKSCHDLLDAILSLVPPPEA